MIEFIESLRVDTEAAGIARYAMRSVESDRNRNAQLNPIEVNAGDEARVERALAVARFAFKWGETPFDHEAQMLILTVAS